MDPVVELGIESLAAGGDGVGRDADGRVTFVARTAPGDRVRARVVEHKRAWARAQLLEVVAPSPERVDPPCPLFAAGTCGGCQWQHVAAAAQAQAKQAIVAGALRGVIAADRIDPIATPVPAYGWRRRARLHWFRPRGEARAVVGLFAPRTHRVTEVPACPQMAAGLQPVLTELTTTLARGLRDKGEIDVVLGHRGDVHVSVRGNVDPAALAALVGRAGIVGARSTRHSFGADAVELEPGVGATSGEFHQASLEGNQALRALVGEIAAVQPGQRVLELHAGSGNFTRLWAGRADVVAVDAQAAPAELPGVVWRQEPAESAVEALSVARERFDVAVLDPPRTGAREVMDGLAQLAPARIVYVSCDPATLGRDAGAIVAAGYTVTRVAPLDLMPQTAHVEVVAAFARAADTAGE